MKISTIISQLKELTFASVQPILWRTWVRYFRFLLLLLVLLGLFYVGSVWYKHFYTLDEIGPDRGQEIELRKNRVRLKEEQFITVNELVEERQRLFTTSPESVPDIFFPEQVDVQPQDEGDSQESKEQLDNLFTKSEISVDQGEVIQDTSGDTSNTPPLSLDPVPSDGNVEGAAEDDVIGKVGL